MRKIEPLMVSWLTKKLEGNGLAQVAIAEKDARLLFRLALEACVGIREQGGANKGPLVQLLQETIGGHGGEPWCMGLVQTGIAFVEHVLGVKSPIYGGDAGEHCMSVWRNTPASQRVKTVPALGAIIIWNHLGTDNGHTGITIGAVKDGMVETIEGNTGGGKVNGEVVREGDGCYRNLRSTTGTGRMKWVGCLKPF